jgi:predicted Holliday junction resolvase-like endonuclease
MGHILYVIIGILLICIYVLYKKIHILQKQITVLEKFNSQQIILNNHIVKAIEKQYNTAPVESILPYFGIIGQA